VPALRPGPDPAGPEQTRLELSKRNAGGPVGGNRVTRIGPARIRLDRTNCSSDAYVNLRIFSAAAGDIVPVKASHVHRNADS
jgi:hypothetical protein